MCVYRFKSHNNIVKQPAKMIKSVLKLSYVLAPRTSCTVWIILNQLEHCESYGSIYDCIGFQTWPIFSLTSLQKFFEELKLSLIVFNITWRYFTVCVWLVKIDSKFAICEIASRWSEIYFKSSDCLFPMTLLAKENFLYLLERGDILGLYWATWKLG